jgi:hypothetical protein
MTPEQRVKIADRALGFYIKRSTERNIDLPSTDLFTDSVQQALMNEENIPKIMNKDETEFEIAKKNVVFSCRFHPTDWWHEVGCPHMQWTNEQLLDAIRGLKVNIDKAHETIIGTPLGKLYSSPNITHKES